MPGLCQALSRIVGIGKKQNKTKARTNRTLERAGNRGFSAHGQFRRVFSRIFLFACNFSVFRRHPLSRGLEQAKAGRDFCTELPPKRSVGPALARKGRGETSNSPSRTLYRPGSRLLSQRFPLCAFPIVKYCAMLRNVVERPD